MKESSLINKVILAHKHSSNNHEEIKKSSNTGCFHCLVIEDKQNEYKLIDRGRTVLCPHCEIDSIIGSASGFPITEEFLKAMNQYYFT